jgi:AraC-like DNA-binding protein
MLANTAPYCPYIHECDQDPRPLPWSSPQRRLAHYLLVTPFDGPEQIAIDGTRYAVRPGQTYLIQPGALLDLRSPGNTPAWIHFDLVYNSERTAYRRAADFESELGERRRLLQPSTLEVFDVQLPVFVPRSLAPLFREEVPRIVQRWREQDALAVFDATQGLARLISSWVTQRWQELRISKPLSAEERIRYAEQTACARLGASFQVADFAAASGFGRTRFATLYKNLRGIGPATFLRGERLRNARHLLVATELPVREVGARVGYADPSVFGRVFHKHVGVSPGDFRQRERQRSLARRA